MTHLYNDGTPELASMMGGFFTGLGKAFKNKKPAPAESSSQKTDSPPPRDLTLFFQVSAYDARLEQARQSGIKAGEKTGLFVKKVLGF